jgi:hypothetical protein
MIYLSTYAFVLTALTTFLTTLRPTHTTATETITLTLLITKKNKKNYWVSTNHNTKPDQHPPQNFSQKLTVEQFKYSHILTSGARSNSFEFLNNNHNDEI